ncbi:MAG: hypothetical protein MK109_10050, partial [Dehalococcoidia bacterium]|nr:hypothetical protein [Dehalococcoidia bacterium]
PGINSAIGAAMVAVGAMAVASEPQAKATAEPPATKANGLRKARRDKLPPRILLVVAPDHFSAQRQNLS